MGKLDYVQTRRVVAKVFKARAAHQLPEAFAIPSDWRLELESLASSLQLPFKTADEISERFDSILEQLTTRQGT